MPALCGGDTEGVMSDQTEHITVAKAAARLREEQVMQQVLGNQELEGSYLDEITIANIRAIGRGEMTVEQAIESIKTRLL
jgi:hypothetical protein